MPRCPFRALMAAIIGTICMILLVQHAGLRQVNEVLGVRSSNVTSLKDLEDQEPKSTKEARSPELAEECICETKKKEKDIPPLYIIIPTYPRAEQIAELTRITQTLMHVPNVFLIVSEDASKPTEGVMRYLLESGMPHTYLRAEMPSEYNKLKKKPRGVANRLAGMDWIRKNAQTGVFYFADDDNTYDIRIFEEMRSTKKVSVFPVGLIADRGVSSPIVKDGKVIGFYDGWIAHRTFPVDMAGFAVNVEFFLTRPNATMPYRPGYEEDGFLISLGISPRDLEPKALGCTKIWVWHTQTNKNKPSKEIPLQSGAKDTNLSILRYAIYTGN